MSIMNPVKPTALVCLYGIVVSYCLIGSPTCAFGAQYASGTITTKGNISANGSLTYELTDSGTLIVTAPQATSGGAVSISTNGIFTATASNDGEIVFCGNVATVGSGVSGGGAIYASTRAVANIERVLFISNTATQRFGGAIVAFGTAVINAGQARFTGNSASSGGAIYAATNATVNAGTATFLGNKAASSGGAIYLTTSSTLSALSALFESNTISPGSANNGGGALYAGGGAAADVSSGSFYYNTQDAGSSASIGGGAIYITSATVIAADGVFYSNTAAGNGGAVFINGGALHSAGASFENNTSGGNGGALYATGVSGSLVLIDAQFIANTSTNSRGGAAYIIGVDDMIIGAGSSGSSVYRGNTAKTSSDMGNGITFAGGAGVVNNLSIRVAAGGVLDMEDPFDSDTGASGRFQFSGTMTGGGLWKLGGKSVLSGSAGNSLAVASGTLALYAGASVTLDNKNASDGLDVFSLGGPGATLRLLNITTSGATAQASGTIKADSIIFAAGSTLSYDLADATAGSSAALLTLNAADYSLLSSGNFNAGIDLVALPVASGSYNLLAANINALSGINTATLVSSLTYRGGLFDGNGFSAAFLYDNKNLWLIINAQAIINRVLSWTGDLNENFTGANWSAAGAASASFTAGDIINLAGASSNNTLALASSATVAGMYISGDENYAITGAGITADGGVGTLSGSAAATGKLVLGAKAPDDAGTPVITTFSGVLDFTGQNPGVANDFKGGVEIHSGALRISSTGQLGTTLEHLSFASTAGGTLAIAANANLVFDSASGTSHRLSIAAGKSAGIIVEPGGTMTLSGNNSASSGGAVVMESGGIFSVKLEPGAALKFENNISSEGGGALASTAGVIDVRGVSFIDNSARATAADADVIGGAIYHFATYDMGVQQPGGRLDITDANFRGNVSISAHGIALGGAIGISTGTLTLGATSTGTSRFSGNTISGLNTGGASVANSIHFLPTEPGGITADVNVATLGLLDMRDAMTAGYDSDWFGDADDQSAASTLAITKTGGGEWRLSGPNILDGSQFASSAATPNAHSVAFAVNDGMLRLTRGAAIKADAVASTFSLASGATLAVAGGNSISARTITLDSNSLLTLDLAGAIAGGVSLLTLNATTLNTNGWAQNISLLNIASLAPPGDALYGLISLGGGHLFTSADLALFNSNVTGLAANYSLVLSPDYMTLQLQYLFPVAGNKLLTWANFAGDGNWSTSATNWRYSVSSTSAFMSGDHAVFTDATGGAITVASSTVFVAGMTVSGGTHAFSGGVIASTTDSTLAAGNITRRLAVSGGADVTLENETAFVRGATLADGVIRLGNNHALGVFSLDDAEPADSAGQLTIANGSGTLALASAAVLDITNRFVVAETGTFVIQVSEGKSLAIRGVNAGGNAGGALASSGALRIQIASGGTLAFSGNTDGAGANTMHLRANGNAAALALDIGAGGVLDMRDPLSGVAAGGSALAVSATGGGLWKLGGTSAFSTDANPASTASVSIFSGTLHLYAQDEVAGVSAGAIMLEGVRTAFVLGGGNTAATLRLGGGNRIGAPDGEIIFGKNSELVFGSASAGDTLETHGLVTLDGATVRIRIDGVANDKIAGAGAAFFTGASSTFAISLGGWTGDYTYDLLASATVAYTVSPTFAFTNYTLNNRQHAQLNQTGTALQLALTSGNNLNLAWNDIAAGVKNWANADSNWLSLPDNAAAVMITNDAVTFGAVGSGTVNVAQAQFVSSMTVAGDYTFSGQAIESSTAVKNPGSVAGSPVALVKQLVIANGASAAFANTIDFENGMIIALGGGAVLRDSGSLAARMPIVNDGVLLIERDTDYTLANALTGSGVTAKHGSGALYLPGNYTTAGLLQGFSGAINLTGTWGGNYYGADMLVAGNNARIGGNAGISGAIDPAGTLFIGGTAAFSNARVLIDLTTADRIAVTGNATLSGATTLDLSTWANGAHTILTAAAIASSGDGVAVTYAGTSLAALVNTRYSATTNIVGSGTLQLITSNTNNVTLTWNGAADATWAGANWTNSGTGIFLANIFQKNDTVIFDDAGNSASPVTLAATATIAAMSVNGANSYTYAGPGALHIIGTLGLNTTGTTTFANTAANVAAGGVQLNSGALALANTTLRGNLAAADGTEIFGAGTLDGNLTALGGNTFTIGLAHGAPVVTSTLAITGTLALANNTTLRFDNIAPGKNDLLTVGALVRGGTSTIDLSTAASGTYKLISSATALAASATDALRTTINNSALTGRTVAGYTIDGASLLLAISTANRAIVWSGTSGGQWIENAANWHGGDDVFFAGDSVTFDNTASGTRSLVIDSGVRASDIIVNTNFSPEAYSFSGSGAITTSTVGTTLSGATGKLIKNGSGSFHLLNTGTNFFEGGIEIAGGALHGSADALRTGVSGIATHENSQLWFTQDAATNNVYANDIGGAGSVGFSLAQGGNLTLAGALSHTGSTSIYSGQVILTKPNQLAASADVYLMYSATLNTGGFDQKFQQLRDAGDIVTGSVASTITVLGGDYAGRLVGAANLVMAGTATFVLGGTQTYSGATTISSGTFVLADSYSGSSAIINNSHLVIGRGNAAPDVVITLPNTISGTGLISKTGPLNNGGKLVLTGNGSAFSGTTIVEGGALVLDNASLGGLVRLDPGAGLGGAGAFGSVVTSGSNTLTIGVAHGAPVATSTLAITGTLALANNTTLRFDNIAPGESDLLTVGALVRSGTSTIDLSTAASGTYKLISSAAALAASATDALRTTINNSVLTGRTTASYSVNSDSLFLALYSSNTSVTWRGAAITAWDETNTNWTSPDQKFLAGDSVTFNDAVSHSQVAIDGFRRVADMTVDTAGEYNFTGSGGIIASTANTTFAAATGKLVKNGAGTLRLQNTGGNTFQGGIEINAGTLDALVSAIGSGRIKNTGTLTIGTSGAGAAETYSGTITGGGLLIKSGNGTLILDNAASDYSGGIRVGGVGVLELRNSGTVTQGAIDLGNPGGAYRIASGAAYTMAHALTGFGVLDINLDSPVAAFNFTAATGTAFSGRVKLGNSAFSLSGANTAALSRDIATLDLGAGNTTTVRDGTQAIGNLALNGAKLIFTATAPADKTAAGIISVKTLELNSGTVQVTIPAAAANPMSSGANLLSQDDGAALTRLITASAVTGNANNLALVDQNNNAITAATARSVAITQSGATVATGTYNYKLTADNGLALGYALASLTIASGQTLDLAPDAGATGAAAILSATVSGRGNLSIAAANAPVTLAAANNFTGTTTVTSGTLIAGANNSLGGAANTLVLNTGAAFHLGAHAQTLSALNTGAASALTLAGGGLTINSGTLDGSLAGNGALLISGSIAINGANPALAAATTIYANAAVTLDHAAALGSGAVTLAAASSALTLNNAAATGTFANTLMGTGTVAFAGGGTTWVAGANAGFSGASVVNGNVVAAHAAALGATAPVTIGANGALAYTTDGVIANAIGGSGTLALFSGTTTLSGANTVANIVVANNANVTAAGAFALGGAGSRITVSNAAVSLAANNMSLGDVALAGAARFGFAAQTGGFRTATVRSLTTTGNAATLTFNTDIGAGTGDTLHVASSISGTYNLALNNTGATPLGGTVALTLIVAPANDAAFVFTGTTIDIGASTYEISLLGGANVAVRVDLRSAIFSNAGELIVNTAGAMPLMWFAGLDNVHKRLGDARLDGDARAKPGLQVWLRTYTQRFDVDSTVTGAKFTENQSGADAGYDFGGAQAGGNALHIGVFAGYGSANRKLSSAIGGDATSDNASGGVYVTVTTPDGWYLDTVAKYNHFKNRIDARSSDAPVKARYTTRAYGVSVEGGRSFTLRNNWFITPQAQAAFAQLSGADYETATAGNIGVELASAAVAQMRAGIQAGRKFTGAAGGIVQPYAKLHAAQQWASGGELKFANDPRDPCKPLVKGARIEGGFGINWQPNKGLRVYFDYECAWAETYGKPYGLNAGVGYSW